MPQCAPVKGSQLGVNPEGAAARALTDLLTAGLHDDFTRHPADAAEEGFIRGFNLKRDFVRVPS